MQCPRRSVAARRYAFYHIYYYSLYEKILKMTIFFNETLHSFIKSEKDNFSIECFVGLSSKFCMKIQALLVLRSRQ